MPGRLVCLRRRRAVCVWNGLNGRTLLTRSAYGVAWRVCWPHAATRDGELGRVRETELTALAKKRWGHGLVVVTRYPGAAGRGDCTRSLGPL